MKVLIFIFGIFLIPSVFAAPTTGGFAADAVLAIKPQLITDTSGIRYWDVPVSRAGVTGVATIGEDFAIGRVLAASRAGTIGLAGLVAVEAVKGVAGMCIWQTDKWHDCTQRPTIPINIDTSKITAATKTTANVFVWSQDGGVTLFGSPTLACGSVGKGVLGDDGYGTAYYCVGGFPVFYRITRSQTTYSCSSGSLTNSSGAPMAVTGQYCTPDTAYSCPSSYFRSDSVGNSDSVGLFCSYTSPVYDDTQAAKILAPYLLNYYANQLFTGKDGKPLDVFSAPNTTFDPAASPSTMPMTLDQLKQYVDWVRNGTAQTTDPLAPHYISPNNYDYTKNYINTNNTTNTNSSSTTITPEQTASAAQGLTQTQYEESNKKTDDKLKTDIAAIPQPAVTGLLTPIDDFTTSVNDIKTAQVPTINKPSAISYGSGTCWSPTIDSLNGSKINAGVYCDNYSQIAHPILYWSIWAGTFIYLWHFGRQTLSARV